MSEEQIRFIGDLQRLDVRPGDRFVLTVDRPISNRVHQTIQEVWERFMGPNGPKLLVLEDGMRLGTLGPSIDDPTQQNDNPQSA